MRYEFVEEMYSRIHRHLRVGVLCLRNCRSGRLLRRKRNRLPDRLVCRCSCVDANALYEGNIALSLLIEVILTFVFVIAILGVTSKKENGAVSGIVIGLTLTLVHILGISFTGTSVNPARSFGPALLVGGEALANVWVFLGAPLVGGALAALVYKFLDSKKAE